MRCQKWLRFAPFSAKPKPGSRHAFAANLWVDIPPLIISTTPTIAHTKRQTLPAWNWKGARTPLCRSLNFIAQERDIL
jgi:hypothetical protein